SHVTPPLLHSSPTRRSSDLTGDPAFAFRAHRISAEQANRIATGGRRPRLSGMSTNGLYRPDHIREVMASGQSAMAACYEAAEYRSEEHTSELQSRENIVCRL